MKTIDTTPYKTRGKQDYKVGEAIAAVMLHHSQNHNGIRLLKASKIAEKFLDAKGPVHVEDAEYDLVRQAFENFSGFVSDDVECVRRVLETAPQTARKSKS